MGGQRQTRLSIYLTSQKIILMPNQDLSIAYGSGIDFAQLNTRLCPAAGQQGSRRIKKELCKQPVHRKCSISPIEGDGAMACALTNISASRLLSWGWPLDNLSIWRWSFSASVFLTCPFLIAQHIKPKPAWALLFFRASQAHCRFISGLLSTTKPATYSTRLNI